MCITGCVCTCYDGSLTHARSARKHHKWLIKRLCAFRRAHGCSAVPERPPEADARAVPLLEAPRRRRCRDGAAPVRVRSTGRRSPAAPGALSPGAGAAVPCGPLAALRGRQTSYPRGCSSRHTTGWRGTQGPGRGALEVAGCQAIWTGPRGQPCGGHGRNCGRTTATTAAATAAASSGTDGAGSASGGPAGGAAPRWLHQRGWVVPLRVDCNLGWAHARSRRALVARLERWTNRKGLCGSVRLPGATGRLGSACEGGWPGGGGAGGRRERLWRLCPAGVVPQPRALAGQQRRNPCGIQVKLSRGPGS